MFWDNPQYQAKFYNFVDKTEKFDTRMKLLPVDFEKPWWDVVLRQKIIASFVLLNNLLSGVIDTVMPLLIGYTITTLDIYLFIWVIAFRLILTWSYNFTEGFSTVFQIKTMASVEQSAHEFFLTVDPIFHSTKSSGKIVSKIQRAGASYEDVLDLILGEIAYTIISLIATIITMFSFGIKLGLVTFGLLFMIAFFNISSQIIRTKSFQPKKIESQDKYNAVAIESVIQAPFIRAIFASIEQVKKLQKINIDFMVKEGNGWQAGTYINATTRTLYILSSLVVGILVINQAISGEIPTVLALSIILTYTSGTQGVLYIGDKVKRLTTALSNINDLFDFIRGFGKQTFPVLEGDTNSTKNTLSLRA
jgi:ABC-type multidrug transport system fused ATPase/permease subunit